MGLGRTGIQRDVQTRFSDVSGVQLRTTSKAPQMARVMARIRRGVIGSCRKRDATTKRKMVLVWFNAAAMETWVNFIPASQASMARYVPQKEPPIV